jgi:hypothetical protein
MTVTAYGCAARLGDTVGEFVNGVRIGGHALPWGLDCQLPKAGVPVDLDHDGHAVGHAVHLEISDGRVHAVAVISDPDVADFLATDDRAVYWSSTFRCIGAGDRYWLASRARVTSLALTYSPAAVGLGAITVLPGSLVDAAGRCNWHARPFLTRALEATRRRRWGEHPNRVLDLDQRKEDERLLELRRRYAWSH